MCIKMSYFDCSNNEMTLGKYIFTFGMVQTWEIVVGKRINYVITRYKNNPKEGYRRAALLYCAHRQSRE